MVIIIIISSFPDLTTWQTNFSDADDTIQDFVCKDLLQSEHILDETFQAEAEWESWEDDDDEEEDGDENDSRDEEEEEESCCLDTDSLDGVHQLEYLVDWLIKHPETTPHPHTHSSSYPHPHPYPYPYPHPHPPTPPTTPKRSMTHCPARHHPYRWNSYSGGQ